MNIWKKLTIFFGAILSIPIIFIAAFFLTGGIFGDCGVDETARIRSPDSKYEAISYQKDCGATTSISTSVALRKNVQDEEFYDVLIVETKNLVRINWVAARVLSVDMNHPLEKSAVFKRKTAWNDVHIRYDGKLENE